MTVVRRRLGPRRKAITLWATLAFMAAALVLVLPAVAGHPEVSLAGSDFEIDTDANLKVNDPAPSIDWASVTEDRKSDVASGSGDDSFGQGAKEDTEIPAVVSGSIPPQKSDLLNFGVYLETNANGRFLNLFWHRVQEPNGTTNMDFEFNQSEEISSNGVTPVRTSGDLLIQYDLSKGGTSPNLLLSRWIDGSEGSTAADCEAANSLPCWDAQVNLSSVGDAAGSINTSAILAADSDGLGNISPRTFGEAQLDFDALTGGGSGQCVSFGSAYLKSRSSDSFTSELKDFIAPLDLSLNQCANVIIRKQTDPDEDPNTTEFGYTKSFATDPSTDNTFTLTDDGVQDYNGTVLPGTGYTVTEDVIPAGWDFVDVDCSASTGVTPSINGATVTFAIDANSDVLDCTYTNRARGTIIVEKITDDGQGSFDFTSTTLTPAAFTLTTTGSGDAGKDSRTFGDLAPGPYDVDETVPAGWNLVSSACVETVGTGSTPAAIDLDPGDTVTCTFHDARERGAILITKTRKHAADGPGDHAHEGVDFTVTGGSLSADVTLTTDANGQACLDGLVLSSFVGNYTVTETVPAGYKAAKLSDTVAVVAEATCASGPKAEVSFSNMPLTNITLSVDSQVDGGTASTIDCGQPNAPTPTGADGDGSVTRNDLEPGTYTCTIVVDP